MIQQFTKQRYCPFKRRRSQYYSWKAVNFWSAESVLIGTQCHHSSLISSDTHRLVLHRLLCTVHIESSLTYDVLDKNAQLSMTGHLLKRVELYPRIPCYGRPCVQKNCPCCGWQYIQFDLWWMTASDFVLLVHSALSLFNSLISLDLTDIYLKLFHAMH